jgi:hypothetical protein
MVPFNGELFALICYEFLHDFLRTFKVSFFNNRIVIMVRRQGLIFSIFVKSTSLYPVTALFFTGLFCAKVVNMACFMVFYLFLQGEIAKNSRPGLLIFSACII